MQIPTLEPVSPEELAAVREAVTLWPDNKDVGVIVGNRFCPILAVRGDGMSIRSYDCYGEDVIDPQKIDLEEVFD